MATTCPCGATIEIDDINVAEGVALCRRCGRLNRLRAIAGQNEVGPPGGAGGSSRDQAEERRARALAQGEPPQGCAIQDYGDRVVLRASARSLSSALGLLFFCAFWNGVVGVFLLILAASIARHIGATLPAWFPTPMGQAGRNMPLGMTIFLGLFLVPFVAVGLAVAGGLLVAICGRIEVRLRGPVGEVFTGIGSIGRRRRFDADAVRAVRFVDSDTEVNNRKLRAIGIESDEKTIKFGSGLIERRRLWLGGVLKAMLLPVANR